MGTLGPPRSGSAGRRFRCTVVRGEPQDRVARRAGALCSAWPPIGTGCSPATPGRSTSTRGTPRGTGRSASPGACASAWPGRATASGRPSRWSSATAARSRRWPTSTRPSSGPSAASPEAVRAVVEAALARGSGNLELPALPAGDPSLVLLREATAAAGRRQVIGTQHVSPIVDTDGDLRGLAGAVQAALGRAARALPPQDGPRPRGRALDRGGARRSRRRAGARLRRGGERLEGRERHRDPLGRADDDVLPRDRPRASRRGASCALSRIVLDGHWAAFDLCLLYRDRLYLLKTGYDERFRKLAPGLVMRLSIVERCFELGIDAHELLGDEAEWKRKFATGERAPRGLPRLRARVQGQHELHLPRDRAAAAQARLRRHARARPAQS